MNNMKRRKFIKSGAAALTTFMIVPRHVLGGKGYISPSSKLNIAGIGIGGKGSGDLRNVESENIIALCDVDERYPERIFHRYPEAKKVSRLSGNAGFCKRNRCSDDCHT